MNGNFSEMGIKRHHFHCLYFKDKHLSLIPRKLNAFFETFNPSGNDDDRNEVSEEARIEGNVSKKLDSLKNPLF